MPLYDFALIEVWEHMFPLHKFMKPICLPEFGKYKMWYPIRGGMKQEPFTGVMSQVSGYGRVESDVIEGKEQTACQAMVAGLQIIPHNERRCSIVSFRMFY